MQENRVYKFRVRAVADDSGNNYDSAWSKFSDKKIYSSASYEYLIATDGDKLIATCESAPENERKIEIRLCAAEMVYSGEPYNGITIEGLDKFNAATGKNVGVDQVKFFRGDEALEGAPVASGTYVAKLAVDNAVAVAQFQILRDETFADIDMESKQWYVPYVAYVYKHNIMVGKKNPDGKFVFDYNGLITRAEFVQILYNIENKPAVTYTESFSDVKEKDWFAKAVIWAAQNNIVKGKGDKFDVSGYATREEIATMLKNVQN